jgi:methionyl-tRNA synthetase
MATWRLGTRSGGQGRHRPGVEALWRRCRAAGDFYLHSYEGAYCPGCEQFYTPGELIDGRCPEHDTPPEPVSERNWFFRLSRYAQRIEHVIESGQVRIVPAARRNEVLAFVRAGLLDFSVSRPAERSGGWGIPVPDDPEQVIYVWWDALTNYVTALGYGSDDAPYRRWWVGSNERTHVIGKGILRFHAVYWLGLLLSAGLPLPTTICVHDYLSLAGAKISKSSRNNVSPKDLVTHYGADGVRWWLVRDVARIGETDFTIARLVDTADRDLANGLGNLISRTLRLAHQHGAEPAAALLGCYLLPPRIDAALDDFDFRAATSTICEAVADANRYIEAQRPWHLAHTDPPRSRAVVGTLIHTCRVIASELTPFLPSGARRCLTQLDSGDRPTPVFPRLAKDPRPATAQTQPPQPG